MSIEWESYTFLTHPGFHLSIQHLDASRLITIINTIDENAPFSGQAVLAYNDKEIKFFDSKEEVLKNGYTLLDINSFLEKSFENITSMQDPQIKKIKTLFIRCKNQINISQVIHPFQVQIAEHGKYSASQLEKEALYLLELYEKCPSPEILKPVFHLLDHAADHYILENQNEKAIQVRIFQQNVLPIPSFTRFTQDASSMEEKNVDRLDSGKIKQGSVWLGTFPSTRSHDVDRMIFKVSYYERELLTKRIESLSTAEQESLLAAFPQ